MPRYDRSAAMLTAHKLGRWMCLRQEWMIAGEMFSPRVSGSIRLSGLREPVALDVQVDLLTFFTPARFLWDDFIDAVKEGVDTTKVVPTISIPTGCAPHDCLGIGRVNGGDTIAEMWLKNYNRIWNWNFRYPETAERADGDDLDEGEHSDADADTCRYGLPAVALESYVTRMRDADSVTDAHTKQSLSDTNTKLNVRDLALTQAKLRSEIERDWLATGRYAELVSERWNAFVGDNPEERPYRLDHHSQWASGHDLFATDGANLGSIQGVMRVDIDHFPGEVVAPEHGIVSYWLCLRWPPLFRDEANPLAATDDWSVPIDWFADPLLVANSPPQAIKARNRFQAGEQTTVLGYHPRGQHFRTGWNHVHSQVSDRNSFPVSNITVGSDAYRSDDHGAREKAFASLAYGHGLGSFRIIQSSDSPVPLPMASVMVGTS